MDYRTQRGVTLNDAGILAALKVIRHHRLIETYMVKTLGYTWEEVHAEADRLEHAFSEDFETRIAEIFGNPTHDPHGEFISSATLSMPADSTILLSALRPLKKPSSCA